MLTNARLPRDSAEVVLVGDGWWWVVSAGFPARDRPGAKLVRRRVREKVDVQLFRATDSRQRKLIVGAQFA